MIELGAVLLSWWLTAWVHLVMLLATVWSAERMGLLRAPSLREWVWRLALFAPLFSASLQTVLVQEPAAGRYALAGYLSVPGSAESLAPRERPLPPVAAVQSSAIASLPPMVVPPRALDARMPETPVSPRVLSILGWLWTALALVLVARIAWRFQRERRRAAALEPVADLALLEQARTLGCVGTLYAVRVVVDPKHVSPSALPPATLCVPPWAVEQLSPAQRRAMLAHEIAHLTRRDPQWRVACAVIAAVLPAPLLGTARKRLDLLAELACDAWSARITGEGRALAESLALCAELGFSGQSTPTYAASMAASRSALVERVRRLIEDQPMHFEKLTLARRGALLLSLALAAATLPGVTLLRPAQAGAQIAPKAPSAQVHDQRMPAPPAPPASPVPPAPPAAPAAPADLPTPPSPPAPPAPPSFPAPPAAPAPPAPDQGSVSISEHRGLFGSSTEIEISRPGYALNFSADGDFSFNAAETDLAGLDDEAALEEERDGVTRRVEFEADGNTISHRYTVDGDLVAFEPAGRQWLAQAIPRVLRETGLNAEARAARLYAAGGSEAVLNEVDQIGSTHGRSAYLTALFNLGTLSAPALERALTQSLALDSDYNLRSTLEALLARQTLSSPQQGRMLERTAQLDSDYERRLLLIAVLPQLQADAAGAWFAALQPMSSDYERRMALEAWLGSRTDPPGQALDALQAMQSDYERRVVLEALAQRVSGAAEARHYVAAASAMSSDYERRMALQALASRPLTADMAGAIRDGASQIHSDYERAQVLEQLNQSM